MGAEHEIFRRQIHFTFKLECVQFNKCHESCLFPAVMHKEICEKDFEGFPQIADASAELLFLCACVCVCVPGPQTVDLIPVFSRSGTLFMAPSICCMNTSQSRSNRLKANLSDT